MNESLNYMPDPNVPTRQIRILPTYIIEKTSTGVRALDERNNNAVEYEATDIASLVTAMKTRAKNRGLTEIAERVAMEGRNV